MVMKGEKHWVGEGLWHHTERKSCRIWKASKSGPLELDLGLKFHLDSGSPSLTIDIFFSLSSSSQTVLRARAYLTKGFADRMRPKVFPLLVRKYILQEWHLGFNYFHSTFRNYTVNHGPSYAGLTGTSALYLTKSLRQRSERI